MSYYCAHIVTFRMWRSKILRLRHGETAGAAGRLTFKQMALVRLLAHDLSATGDLEALLGTRMGLHLRHSCPSLLLLQVDVRVHVVGGTPLLLRLSCSRGSSPQFGLLTPFLFGVGSPIGRLCRLGHAARCDAYRKR